MLSRGELSANTVLVSEISSIETLCAKELEGVILDNTIRILRSWLSTIVTKRGYFWQGRLRVYFTLHSSFFTVSKTWLDRQMFDLF